MHFQCLFSSSPDKWSPALQIRTVLLSIQALLSAPNPDDPLANDVAELWKVKWKLFLFLLLMHCVHYFLYVVIMEMHTGFYDGM